MLYPLSYGDRDSNFRFLPPSGDGALSTLGGDPPFNRATGQMREPFKFCGAPGFERFDWKEARTFDPVALRRRTRASARPLLHYSRRRRNLSRRRGRVRRGASGSAGGRGLCAAKRSRRRQGLPVDAASGGGTASVSCCLPGCPPLFPLSLWMLSCGDRSAGNPQRQFRARAGACTAGRLRQRRGAGPLRGEAFPPPAGPARGRRFRRRRRICGRGGRLPGARRPVRQGKAAQDRPAPPSGAVSDKRSAALYEGGRYISLRNSALRSSTFVSRGFPGRQASA